MIDLHIHSTASDGQYCPSEIVEMAVQKGLKAIALTDHDTVNGLEQASRVGKEHEILFVPGIELSLQGILDVKELHILGYWIDWQSKELQKLCVRTQMLLRNEQKRFMLI